MTRSTVKVKTGGALNVLVIGAGMYVCGRGTETHGTIMPAIYEWKRTHDVGEVYIAGTGPEGLGIAKTKIEEIERNTGVHIPLTFFPEGDLYDLQCYRRAIRKIPKPACAIVVVPDNLHREVAGEAIEGGLHTLVVKPLAPTLKEVYELIDLQRRKGMYCAVEFHKRFDYANLKLRDTIREGAIGDPLYFLVEFSQRKSVPAERFRKWVEATNIFQYLGVHYVDIIYFATGAKPLRAMALGQKGWLYSKGIDTYDSIEGTIEWEMPDKGRFTSCILTNWIDPESTSAMSDQKIKVIGTKGRFESDQKRRGVTIVSDEKGIKEPNPYFCAAYNAPGQVSYRGYGIESIHQFLKDVEEIEMGVVKIDDLEGERPTFKESIVPTAVIEAVNKSLKDGGQWVSIHEVSK
jgi:predicted dehydrogenase